MDIRSRAALRISDLFVATAVVAAFAIYPVFGTVQLGFIALCITLVAVWDRPLIFRFWACGMLGFGTGMFVAGVYDLTNFPMPQPEIIGWGAGIVIGTIAAIILFLGPLRLDKR